MSIDKIMSALQSIEGIEQLDTLLLAREGARRVYAFLQDAYAVTGNAVFLEYQETVAAAGKSINEDLRILAIKMSLLHGSHYDEPQ